MCFLISVIEFFISDWVFFIFPSSLLKLSLCSCILFSNSVNNFITNAFNSLSDKLFLFYYFFQGFSLIISIESNSSASMNLGATVSYRGLEGTMFL